MSRDNPRRFSPAWLLVAAPALFVVGVALLWTFGGLAMLNARGTLPTPFTVRAGWCAGLACLALSPVSLLVGIVWTILGLRTPLRR